MTRRIDIAWRDRTFGSGPDDAALSPSTTTSPTMRLLSPCLRALALASLSTVTLLAQNPAGAPAPGPMRMPPITLGPDDVRAVPDAPTGFNAKREGIPHGTLEMIEYDSK